VKANPAVPVSPYTSYKTSEVSGGEVDQPSWASQGYPRYRFTIYGFLPDSSCYGVEWIRAEA